jgi:hypothetical protein
MSPKHIWDQQPKPGDNDPKLHMLHASDMSLFRTVEKHCGWDLSALKDKTPILVEAERL